MPASYGETLQKRQLEGLRASEEQRLWRALRLAEEVRTAAPDGAGWEAAAPPQPPRQNKKHMPAAEPAAARQAGQVVECRGCWYWRTLDYTMELKACWYPLLEDRLRPCCPADCYRKPGTPYRPWGVRRAKRGGRRGRAGAGEKRREAGDPAGQAPGVTNGPDGKKGGSV